MTKRELLQRFGAKARCMHTQQVANSYWHELLPLLTTSESASLSIAWGHHVDVGEGPEELDDVCATLLAEWDT